MAIAETRKIGLFGGTFDPPHRGHLAAAESAMKFVGLDTVHFLVANDPWQKSGTRSLTPAHLRLSMTRALLTDLAGESRDRFIVDDREVARGGATYTVDTLEQIHAESPGVSIHLIVGQDTGAKIASTWRRPERIFELATIVVVSRDSAALRTSELPSDSIYVEMDPVDVSSSAVRASVERGLDVSGETSPGVMDIIAANHLYRGAR